MKRSKPLKTCGKLFQAQEVVHAKALRGEVLGLFKKQWDGGVCAGKRETRWEQRGSAQIQIELSTVGRTQTLALLWLTEEAIGMLELWSDRSVLSFKRVSLAKSVVSSEVSYRNIKALHVRDDRGVRGDWVPMDWMWSLWERQESRITSPRFLAWGWGRNRLRVEKNQ